MYQTVNGSQTSKKSKNLVNSKFITHVILLICVMAIVAASGCNFAAPRARLGTLPSATIGIPFPDPNDLGSHSYTFTLFEKNGIVYTCKAGHIDIYHLRGTADAAKYLIEKSHRALIKKSNKFSFNLTGETSRHIINLTYPENWDSLSSREKENIASKVSFELGPYLAYNATVWHEILTWFGVHFAGFEPEFNSAFSWEDVYSNLLGARLAALALKDIEHDYNTAMTLAIQQELKKLNVQSAELAYRVSDKMRGKWFTGNLLVDTKMRNFDIGLDGTITPTLIPDVSECSDQPLSYPAPDLNVFKGYGFSMTYEIKPYVFEQGRIFKAAGEKKIYPRKHYPIIMEYIKAQAKEKGYEFDD